MYFFAATHSVFGVNFAGKLGIFISCWKSTIFFSFYIKFKPWMKWKSKLCPSHVQAGPLFKLDVTSPDVSSIFHTPMTASACIKKTVFLKDAKYSAPNIGFSLGQLALTLQSFHISLSRKDKINYIDFLRGKSSVNTLFF